MPAFGDRVSSAEGNPAPSAWFARDFEQHRPTLLRLCARILRDHDAAEDVVQETYIRANGRLHLLDRERPLLPWLVTIAQRLAINELRRPKERPVGANGSWLEELPESETLGVATDSVFENVLIREDYALAIEAMRRLPSRQKRILMKSLAGSSTSQIASEERISSGAVRILLFRAREGVRRACRSRFLGGLMAPLSTGWHKLHHMGLSVRRRVPVDSSNLINSTAQPLSSMILALVFVIDAFAPTPRSLPSPTRAPVAMTAVPEAVTGGASKGRLVAAPSQSKHGSQNEPAYGPQPVPLLNPQRYATPESTLFESMAVSPNYERDHTIFAAGRVPCTESDCSVLFVSHDGGASWQRLQARGFKGYELALSPSYPADRRIFAMSLAGLQVSSDHGRTFRVVAPLSGGMAVSPLFASGDPRILIASLGIHAYNAETHLTAPELVAPSPATWMQVAFSPKYADDHLIYVGGFQFDSAGIARPTVFRCKEKLCHGEMIRDPEAIGTPWLRLSPFFATDHILFAFDGHHLFRSADGGGSFRTQPPMMDGNWALRDVAFLSESRPGHPVLAAAVWNIVGPPGGVFLSDDGGYTWRRRSIPLRGFEIGAEQIITTPNGRLLAAGPAGGLACSVDRGRTWHRRCPREGGQGIL